MSENLYFALPLPILQEGRLAGEVRVGAIIGLPGRISSREESMARTVAIGYTP